MTIIHIGKAFEAINNPACTSTSHLRPRHTPRIMGLILSLLFLSLSLGAQTPNTASVRGQVSDSSGAAVAQTEVTLTNMLTGLRRVASSDASGYYAFVDLPLTGEYQLRVAKAGMAGQTQDKIQLRAGETATLNITLNPEGGRSEITVFGTTEGVRSDSPQLGTRWDLEKIDQTPVFSRKITTLALLNAAVRPARGTGDLFLNNTLLVINGSGRRQTSFTIDGSTGDDAWGRQTIFTNIPLAALQEFTVLTQGFSAEYGRTTGGVVNVVTQSGTNQYHGEFLGLWRPAGIQARVPLSLRRTADRLGQLSSAFSGPILQDRTHFLLAAEYNHQNRDTAITSPLAPGNFTGHNRQMLFLARIDHQINDRHTLTGRINFDRFYDTNPGDTAVGGLSLPSADRIFRRRTYVAQLAETAALSRAVINEGRLQFQLGSPITQFDPVTPSTQFVRPGLATEGESRVANLQNRQLQMADTLSITRSNHSLKIGGDAIYSSSGGTGQEFGGGFVLGQFTLRPGVDRPISDLTIGDVQRFVQSFGNQSYHVREWLGAVFAQDSIRVRPTLTLNLGLRYERQSFTDAHKNFAPRVGFAYNVLGDRRTVLRGGYGIYYSEIRANLAAGYSIGGPRGIVTLGVSPGQLGFPTTLAPLPAFPPGAVLPPRDITVRPGQRGFLSQFFDVSLLHGYPDRLLNPYTQQWTFGIERELAAQWFLGVDYVHQRTIKIDRPIDLNAPARFDRTAPGQVRSGAEADATRPILPVLNGFRRIVATINEGVGDYNALQANLSKRFRRNFSLLVSYTYSHTINTVEPDVPGQDPNDANQLGRAERATSLLDQRHRAVISGWWQLPYQFTVGGVATLASGRPYNITTGVDNNGDGSTADRPVVGGRVLSRNAGRGTPVYDMLTFVERAFKLPGDRMKLSLRAEAFNLFNHSNIVGRNGVYGNLTSGAPLNSLGQALGGINNVDPGREFQFILRLRF